MWSITLPSVTVRPATTATGTSRSRGYWRIRKCGPFGACAAGACSAGAGAVGGAGGFDSWAVPQQAIVTAARICRVRLGIVERATSGRRLARGRGPVTPSRREGRSRSAPARRLARRGAPLFDARRRGRSRSETPLMRAASPSRLLDAIAARFRDELGAGGTVRRFFAPGRINLVGAHLDYNGGDVRPMAVDRGIYLAIRKRDDARIRVRSIDQPLAVDVDIAQLGARTRPEWGWAGYPLGVFCGF